VLGSAADRRPEGSDAAIYRALVRDRGYRNLLLAALTSALGDWIGLFAIIALAEGLEGATRTGALSVAFVMAARVLPTLALGPVAGVFVDRWDRKRTMVVTDIVRGSVMLSVAFVGDAFQLIVATFVIEVASTMFIPAKDAILPNVVPRGRLVQANQLSLIATYGTLPLGALIYTVLVALTERYATAGLLAERPVVVPILVNALSFVVSALFIRGVVVRPGGRTRRAPRVDESKSAWQELTEGFAFVAGKPLIRALVGGVMAAFVAAGFVISLGTFFATIVNAGDVGFGVLAFAVGAGLVIGLAGAGPLAARVAKERLFAPGIATAGGALVVTALMPRLDLALPPAVVMGAGAGLAFVTGYTMLQEHSDDEIRGRTFAAFNSGVRLALFASLFVGPLMIFLLGVERTQAQIDAGQEVTTTAGLEDLGDGTYPYQIGGIRITLMLGGLVGVAGAAVTGRSVRRALAAQRVVDESGHAAGPPATWPDGRGGAFVVFEGGDGAGKGTQLRLLRAAVEHEGREVLLTREPGGTELAEHVRDLVLDPSLRVGPRAEALLYAAARAQHTEEVLRPALERGAVVLCDRYVDSSVVYQGVARGLGADVVAELNAWGTGRLEPDLVVLLDVDAAVGLARVEGEHDRLEGAGLDFHRLVNQTYRELAGRDTARYLVLDGTLPVGSLHATIRDRVHDVLAAAADAAVGDPLSEAEYEAVVEEQALEAAEERAAEDHPDVAVEADAQGPVAAHGEPGRDQPVDGPESQDAGSFGPRLFGGVAQEPPAGPRPAADDEDEDDEPAAPA
jgi:dTMP kinase